VNEVKKYIAERYKNWLDYAIFQCRQAGMTDSANDVLNEVMLCLLSKPDGQLERLYAATRGTNREIDYYVLKMIRLSACSPTSAYQYKYNKKNKKTEPLHDAVTQIEDIEYDESDEAIPDERITQILTAFRKANLSEHDRRLFSFFYIEGKNLKDWNGGTNIQTLRRKLQKISKIVKSYILK
jgi:hypothetical protein